MLNYEAFRDERKERMDKRFQKYNSTLTINLLKEEAERKRKLEQEEQEKALKNEAEQKYLEFKKRRSMTNFEMIKNDTGIPVIIWWQMREGWLPPEVFGEKVYHFMDVDEAVRKELPINFLHKVCVRYVWPKELPHRLPFGTSMRCSCRLYTTSKEMGTTYKITVSELVGDGEYGNAGKVPFYKSHESPDLGRDTAPVMMTGVWPDPPLKPSLSEPRSLEVDLHVNWRKHFRNTPPPESVDFGPRPDDSSGPKLIDQWGGVKDSEGLQKIAALQHHQMKERLFDGGQLPPILLELKPRGHFVEYFVAGLLAWASSGLALIGLKKCQSFQKLLPALMHSR